MTKGTEVSLTKRDTRTAPSPLTSFVFFSLLSITLWCQHKDILVIKSLLQKREKMLLKTTHWRSEKWQAYHSEYGVRPTTLVIHARLAVVAILLACIATIKEIRAAIQDRYDGHGYLWPSAQEPAAV